MVRFKVPFQNKHEYCLLKKTPQAYSWKILLDTDIVSCNEPWHYQFLFPCSLCAPSTASLKNRFFFSNKIDLVLLWYQKQCMWSIEQNCIFFYRQWKRHLTYSNRLFLKRKNTECTKQRWRKKEKIISKLTSNSVKKLRYILYYHDN